MYFRIKQYCDIIPDYVLFFTFAKNKTIWPCLWPLYWRDILQIIALCVLENNTLKNKNNAIGRELNLFGRHVLDIPQRKLITKKKYKSNPPLSKCGLCGKEKREYLRGSLIPGKKICGACYQKIYNKKRKGVKYMYVVDLISNAIKDYPDIYIPEKTEKGVCCLTGIECQTVARKDIFSSNFTNFDILKAPDSDRIGISAAIALKYRTERSSWFVNETEFIRFDKNLFREMFLKGVKKSKYWAIYITTSYKKHGALVTRVNSCGNGNHRKFGIWRFEQLDVDATDEQKNRRWYKLISEAYIKNGISRGILETLNCPEYVIKKVGISIWLKYEKWARRNYNNPLYKLCCYLLPSQADLKNENK